MLNHNDDDYKRAHTHDERDEKHVYGDVLLLFVHVLSWLHTLRINKYTISIYRNRFLSNSGVWILKRIKIERIRENHINKFEFIHALLWNIFYLY